MAITSWYIATVYLVYEPPRPKVKPRIVVRLPATDAEDYRARVRQDCFPSAVSVEFGPVTLSKVQT